MVTCTTPPFRAAVPLNSGVRAHMTRFLAALVFVCVSACATRPFSVSPTGCYSAGDATRYVHFSLELSPNQTFKARLRIHASDYGATSGHWSLEGNKIVLVAGKPNEALKHATAALPWHQNGTLSIPDGSVPFSGFKPLTPSKCEP